MKKKRNLLFTILTVLSLVFGFICLCVAVSGGLRGTMSPPDVQTGLFAAFVFVPIAGFWYLLSIPPESPHLRLNRIAETSLPLLRQAIEVSGETVKLGKFTLSPDGFTHRSLFRKFRFSYSEPTHYRARLFRFRVRAVVSAAPLLTYHTLRLRSAQGERMAFGRLSFFPWLRKNVKALLYIEERVRAEVLRRETARHQAGEKLDFGELSLQGGTLAFPGRTLALNDVASWQVNDVWISFDTKLPGAEAQAHFKRKKVWNEAVLFAILRERASSPSAGSSGVR